MGVDPHQQHSGTAGQQQFQGDGGRRRKLGYKEVHTGRMAINSEPRDGRGSCQQIGFCFQGCKSGAKWSTLYTEIPKGEATGNLEVRPSSMALKIEHDAAGKVTGVVYVDEDGKTQRQKARIVAVAGNSIESPRLLLNSASSMFPRWPCQQLRPGRPQLHAAHDRQRLCGVRQVGAHVSRHHHGRHHPRRGAARSVARLHRRLRDGDAVARSAVHGGLPQSGRLGPPVHRGDGRLSATWPACGWSARTCRRRPTGSRSIRKPRTSSACRSRASIMTITPTTSRCAIMPTSRAPRSTRRSARRVTYPTTPYPSTHNMGTNRMSAKAERRRRQQIRPDPRHQEPVRLGWQPVHQRRCLQSDPDHRRACHQAGGPHRRGDAAQGNLTKEIKKRKSKKPRLRPLNGRSLWGVTI